VEHDHDWLVGEVRKAREAWQQSEDMRFCRSQTPDDGGIYNDVNGTLSES
jgi:hypothetical protein